MKYLNIIAACAAEPWALERSKLVAIASFLRFKAAGGEYSADEVAARMTKKRDAETSRASGNIGLLPIDGVIGERMSMLDDISGGTSSELITKQFRGMLNDDQIKAIVLRINSPGGVARSVDEVAQEIYDARGIKPIIAQIDTCAASAAYWLACAADEIVVTPSGQAGSIGVYTMHQDISEMLANEGIKETLIYSGQYKVLGNQFEPLSADARAIMQERVDQLAESFVRAVARGRNTTLSDVNDNYGQGLMFNADDLVKRGMADRVAPLSETLARFGIDMNPALTAARAAPLAKPAARAEIDDQPRLENWVRAINDGEVPSPKEFEAFLREAGVSKSQRARIASRMHALLRSESGEGEADQSAVVDAMAQLRQAVEGFTVPKLQG